MARWYLVLLLVFVCSATAYEEEESESTSYSEIEWEGDVEEESQAEESEQSSDTASIKAIPIKPGDVIDFEPTGPAPPLCDSDKEYRCVNQCSNSNCREAVVGWACIAIPLPCTFQCVCKEPGYHLNAIGECVTLDQCKQCSKPNEFFSCGPECDNECKTIGIQNRTNCPIINKKCNEKCYCEDGYARDANGNCIPVDKCEKPLVCGRNEVEKCARRCPPERTCERPYNTYRCRFDPRPCQKKCVCADGYVRNSFGQCITLKQCKQCSKSNEVFSCGDDCDNECGFVEQRKNCPFRSIDTCQEKCYCKDGYARDPNRNCVPIKQCDSSCRGANEELQCIQPCPGGRTCKNIAIPVFCPLAIFPCNAACVCKEGYARNNRGICIRISKCPPLCKDPNEEYISTTSCPPDTCDALVTKYNCDVVSHAYKCRCKDGYFRLKPGGRCVPRCKCPQVANTKECRVVRFGDRRILGHEDFPID